MFHQRRRLISFSLCLAANTIHADLVLHTRTNNFTGRAAVPARTSVSLANKAKISKGDARLAACAKVPDGSVISCEIQNAKGLLIWSCDFTRPRTKNITEVQVNARTGKIASVKIKIPADQPVKAPKDVSK